MGSLRGQRLSMQSPKIAKSHSNFGGSVTDSVKSCKEICFRQCAVNFHCPEESGQLGSRIQSNKLSNIPKTPRTFCPQAHFLSPAGQMQCEPNLLHFFRLRFLLGQVILHTIIKDGAHSKCTIATNQGFDVVLVLPCHKLSIKGHLHQLPEEPSPQQGPTQIDQLQQ